MPKVSPTKNGCNKNLFNSFCTQPRSPEYIKDSEITSSLGRTLQESSLGTDYEDASKVYKDIRSQTEAWLSESSNVNGLTKGQIAEHLQRLAGVPKTPKQTATKQLHLYPLTQSIAQISSFVKLHNPWDPGKAVFEFLARGMTSPEKLKDLWIELANNWSVHLDTKGEDLSAEFFENAARNLLPEGKDPWAGEPKSIPETDQLVSLEKSAPFTIGSTPAESLAKDLQVLIKLQKQVTRTNWIAMLDGLLRVAIPACYLWCYHCTGNLKSFFQRSLQDECLKEEITQNEIFTQTNFKPLNHGAKDVGSLEDKIRKYIFDLNFCHTAFQWLQNNQIRAFDEWADAESINNKSGLSGLHEILKSLNPNSKSSLRSELEDNQRELKRSEDAIVQKQRSWTKNTFESLQYLLRQRSVVDQLGFDQSYWCKKVPRGSTSAKNDPWLLEPSDLNLSLFVHLAAHDENGIKLQNPTARRLRKHLQKYGYAITDDELSKGVTGNRLRRLGRVTDSSDAEGGMMLVSAFHGDVK